MKLDLQQLAKALERNCPQVVFALLYGSARNGEILPGSDLDLAVYLNTKPTLTICEEILRAVEDIAPNIEIDLGILNQADPIYAFETLKGHLLFARDQEAYLRFYSLICRLYESQMASYKRQHTYRLEAAQARKKWYQTQAVPE